ncbi:MAG: RNase adapter RapZ [Firmicutes bacterium]|nr:RNase adapter RapZ [Alicyclobacillaceae bacterium]MCL6497510.1 RNase adapter RapZ [Bacillota bacterium]
MAARLVIITGLSGAGRSQAMRAFEDLGYFCVDNLPPSLIPKFFELIQKSPEVKGAALVLDVRGGIFFRELEAFLDELDAEGVHYQILFLEADEEVQIRRYQETRRRHPLETQYNLIEAIRVERQALEALRGRADVVVNTSELTPMQLRHRLAEIFRLDPAAESLTVRLVSFGFKHGLPKDADMVLDVRFLPNPHYIAALRPKDGNDPAVREWLFSWPVARETLTRFESLLDFLIPLYQEEGKPSFTLAVGCTGGQHRSVVFANALAQHLQGRGRTVKVEHRELQGDR